jgi:ribosomal protein S27AE
MVTWKLKSCPRCKGDIFIYRETDGWYEHCLLCGYLHDLEGADSVHQNGVDLEQEQPTQAK